MSSDLTARVAHGLEDARAIYALLVLAHDEGGLADPEHGPAFEMVLHTVETEAVIVVEQEGAIIGSLGLELCRFWYAPSKDFLSNLWFFVAAPFRHGPAIRKLIDEAKEIAGSVGVPLVLMKRVAV